MGQRRQVTTVLTAVAMLAAGLLVQEGSAAEVWVTNMKSANVQVFNPATMQVSATIPADKGAHNVTFSPDGKRAFIANVGANNVTIIDAVKKKPLGNVAAGTRAH
jgi:YVTN family beta-propeller protein